MKSPAMAWFPSHSVTLSRALQGKRESTVEPYMAMDLLLCSLGLDTYQKLLYPIDKHSRGKKFDRLPLAC